MSYLEISHIISVMDFSDWITARFLEWRGNRVGRGSSIADFARELGASQQIMSEWMKKGGKVPKAAKYVNALIRIYGDEVYTVLGIDTPDRIASKSELALASLPAEFRVKLLAAIAEASAEISARGVQPDSPDGLRITAEVFTRNGINVQLIQ